MFVRILLFYMRRVTNDANDKGIYHTFLDIRPANGHRTLFLKTINIK